jgi:hypothetical protein
MRKWENVEMWKWANIIPGEARAMEPLKLTNRLMTPN